MEKILKSGVYRWTNVHNGKVYMYSANERINDRYYKLVVEGYLKDGYNKTDTQEMALQELKLHFDINFK